MAQKSEGECFVLNETNSDDYDFTKSCVKFLSSTYVVYVKKTDKVSVSSWTELQNAINNAEYETVFTLTQTLNANGASAMRIPDGKKVIINLNGFDLNRGLTSEGSAGHVIQMKGSSTLTIRDTSANQSGKITGGWSEHGGGINVDEDGGFDLRINNKNWEELYFDHDDNVNLWHCHGENDRGGVIYGCDPDGNVLSVNQTL